MFTCKRKVISVIMILTMMVFTGSAYAADTEKDPYFKPDETWISLSGTAIDAETGWFTLDYGDGTITVEMDEWDWYAKDKDQIEGSKVTVYGEVDDNTLTTDTIEASSVYVESMGTYFYASADRQGRRCQRHRRDGP